MLLDVIEPQQPACGCDIQRAVPNRHAVGLIQPAGNHHDTIRLIVLVRVDDRVHLADVLGTDEHRALWAQGHRARVLHLLGEDFRLEPSR
jgi:hypothetical protein